MIGLTFAAPMVLTALIGLPVLWVILRALPPRPRTRVFAAVTLLLGLKDTENTASKTPLWLLVLRSLAVAAIIIGLAGPRLNHQPAQDIDAPLLILIDGGWAMAPRTEAAREFLVSRVERAQASDQLVAVLDLARPEPIVWNAPDMVVPKFKDWTPVPWALDWALSERYIADLSMDRFDVLWVSDGLGYEGQRAQWVKTLSARGDIDVFEQTRDLVTIQNLTVEKDQTTVQIATNGTGLAEGVLRLHGVDPMGAPTVIADVPMAQDPTATRQNVTFSVPNELLARVSKFEILDQRHIGAQYLVADQLRRPKIALLDTVAQGETVDLLDPLHYVNTALVPFADMYSGTISDLLLASPDVMIAADVVTLPDAQDVLDWVQNGGTLIRFAGPRMAIASTEMRDDPLMPVTLRQGGRSLGGAMSWDTPKAMADFSPQGIFGGLQPAADVRISAQVLAQPELTLSDKTLAMLEDRTPLVTATDLGQGRVILFHVGATPEWSNLPLSGLFVDMLTRLVRPGLSVQDETDISGSQWTPVMGMTVFGGLRPIDNLAAVEGGMLASSQITQTVPIGVFTADSKSISRNIGDIFDGFTRAQWPTGVTMYSDLERADAVDLRAAVLLIALAALMVDVLASLWISGRLVAAVFLGASVIISTPADPLWAQDQVPNEIALGHIITGDASVDRIAFAGLQGLSEVLFARTAIEPSAPVSVDLEQDDIAIYPLLYWPITVSQPIPSDRAYAKLNTFLQSGGVIVFDTRDAGAGRRDTPENRALRQILAPLNIPPLEIVPQDHVLTRAFYLLQSFPGRYHDAPVWIEAAAERGTDPQGKPFRDLNDGVTPVVIGGHDWAAAWAVDAMGRTLVPVGRGFAGERQREMAYRFGVNLVMHVLMGNYKSDQVHVPALLERLGQ